MYTLSKNCDFFTQGKVNRTSYLRLNTLHFFSFTIFLLHDQSFYKDSNEGHVRSILLFFFEKIK